MISSSITPTLRKRRVPDGKPSLEDIDNAPENLPAIIDPAGLPVPSDELQPRFTELANVNFELDLENKALKGQLSSKKVIEDLLSPTARRAFVFLCCYGLGALVLLILHGFGVGGFALPESVLGLVVGSTAISAIGVFTAVIVGLFAAIKKV